MLTVTLSVNDKPFDVTFNTYDPLFVNRKPDRTAVPLTIDPLVGPLMAHDVEEKLKAL